jgi:hypothetical protein
LVSSPLAESPGRAAAEVLPPGGRLPSTRNRSSLLSRRQIESHWRPGQAQHRGSASVEHAGLVTGAQRPIKPSPSVCFHPRRQGKTPRESEKRPSDQARQIGFWSMTVALTPCCSRISHKAVSGPCDRLLMTWAVFGSNLAEQPVSDCGATNHPVWPRPT